MQRLSRSRLLALAAAGVTATGLAACGSDDDTATTGGSGAAATTAGGSSQRVAVTIGDGGCEPATASVRSGAVTFEAKNPSSSQVDEFEVLNEDGIILGEKENLAPGLSGNFSLTLQPGTYVMNCILAANGEDDPHYGKAKLTVTGGSVATPGDADDPALAKAVEQYKAYVERETAELVRGVAPFVAALKGGDLQGAKDQFGPLRMHYERIEPIAESFGDLDPQIDARVNDVADRAQWTGFHRIEQILWTKDTTKGTERYATKLQKDIGALAARVKQVEIQPAQLANGALGLLDEVANSKITGEEDRYSHTDLADFQGNLEGARKAFELLVPALKERGEGELVTTIQARFADVQEGLDAYRRKTPLGFALYDELTDADRKRFSQQIDALAEPLSLVAGKVLH
ncbi:iron uptake system protein EfeO [Patulibacter brassicae]|jgi:iron uptake system component EfeO|uniref:Iron uptake system protein EfeO n=1 Tax=Patulibacter brassicae TaxID=1705717 RepID=A0ABU4VS18_9ACTN|nr:iron uptake system protein EfeO [Patulibacter brassicae]MDX8153693.1 iron uptake system protein EfeO [Patulibacter brassicae]